jgi:hypothetical protein
LQLLNQKILPVDRILYPDVAQNYARSIGASVIDQSITACLPSDEMPSKEIIERTSEILKAYHVESILRKQICY